MITWKTNGIFKADAEKVAQEIESIEKATPKSVLEYARDEKSELHKCFEWNDSIAAEKWRMQQARTIICNLVYKEPEDEKQQPCKLRVFYSAEHKEYKPTKIIMKNKDEYTKLLERAYSELRSFKEKYKVLTELEEIFSLID